VGAVASLLELPEQLLDHAVVGLDQGNGVLGHGLLLVGDMGGRKLPRLEAPETS
jgi:hypothetical protein